MLSTGATSTSSSEDFTVCSGGGGKDDEGNEDGFAPSDKLNRLSLRILLTSFLSSCSVFSLLFPLAASPNSLTSSNAKTHVKKGIV